jgi:hypothetical protein
MGEALARKDLAAPLAINPSLGLVQSGAATTYLCRPVPCGLDTRTRTLIAKRMAGCQ